MSIKCPKCKKIIDNSYIKEVKTVENFKCPSCRVLLAESEKSKIITILIAIMPIIVLAFTVNNFFIKILAMFTWGFISTTYIRSLLSKYKVVAK